MKLNILLWVSLCLSATAHSQVVSSPDARLQVSVDCQGGKPTYSVSYDGEEFLAASPLGLTTNIADMSQGLSIASVSEVSAVADDYTLYNIKRRHNSYRANARTYSLSKDGSDVLRITFQVSNNDVAFRYEILPQGDTRCCVVNAEATGFRLPQGSTAYVAPQMGSMTGFARTAPSYETHYDIDPTLQRNGWGLGYTFPALFRMPEQRGEGWVLVSETGVDGSYCASRLTVSEQGLYAIAYPDITENNGYGSTGAQVALPSATPWRTITVGKSLKPIVETTIAWDVLGNTAVPDSKRAEVAQKYGRGSWSWIIANDESCNFDTQKQYIDFSAAMGWESLLIDAMWDTQIGRDKMAELAQYAHAKGVSLYLWYNSNGKWNDAPQGPRHCMDTSRRRRAEMEWMKSIGIRGIKVDFFGGDKQCTMQLYEDILHDAEDFGLMVIFHGCTLPRGWERMYPNYVASEAVRASENLHFGQAECDREAYSATFLPFIRNSVGSMDFGGSTLNWYYNPLNSDQMWGGHRVTSDVFALATAILFQSAVQHFAMAPNNLTDAPQWAVDFMKTVPTQWEDVRYIDGCPGKYVVLARKHEGKWIVAGINGQDAPVQISLDADQLGFAQQATLYSDDQKLQGSCKPIKLRKGKAVKVSMPKNGAFVLL